MTQVKIEHANSTSSKKSLHKKKLNITQSLFSGSMAGAIEILVNHPLWTIKTRMQIGEKFTINSRVLYTGILPSAASMIPTTGVQVGLNQSLQTILFSNTYELSTLQSLSSAFIAGIGSALISCPTEMMITNQGRDGVSFYTAGKRLMKQNGWSRLYTGLVATGLRDGLFTMSFLGATPLLKAQLQPYCSNNENQASLLAGIVSGVSATLASHGFDTIKTRQQSDPKSIGFVSAAKDLYTSSGSHGFFKGIIPRGTRVVSAVTLMGFAKEKIEKLILDNADQKVSSIAKRS